MPEEALLNQIGIPLAVILAVAGIVNPTVNQVRRAYALGSKQTVNLAYGLSIILTGLLTYLLSPGIILESYGALFIARMLVGGWFSAVWAGQIADTQKKTDEVRAEREGISSWQETLRERDTKEG